MYRSVGDKERQTVRHGDAETRGRGGKSGHGDTVTRRHGGKSSIEVSRYGSMEEKSKGRLDDCVCHCACPAEAVR